MAILSIQFDTNAKIHSKNFPIELAKSLEEICEENISKNFAIFSFRRKFRFFPMPGFSLGTSQNSLHFFIILFCILILIYILSMPFHKIFIEMSAAYDAVKISCSISKTKRANVVESSSRWDVIFYSKKKPEGCCDTYLFSCSILYGYSCSYSTGPD